ncbi:MAG TPA: hypothetical protein VMT82_07395 [candidate division Zixibacteria bacterium]|nr:hypothetical protein [candidate division Zixibacteria bacterium]
MANRSLAVLSVLLLATFMLAQGQYDSSSSQQSGQSQTGSATSSPTDTTIEGCLQASGGNYTLTDDSSGKTYQLQGDTSKFSAHTGHQVRLTGTTSGPSSSAASGMTSSSSEQPTFVVSKLKHISTTCKASNK